MEEDTRQCRQCGKAFLRRGRTGPVPLYCSANCRTRFNQPTKGIVRRPRPVVSLRCVVCNATFLTKRAEQRYCSIRCMAQSRRSPIPYSRRHKRGKPKPAECQWCGQTFQPKNYPNVTYCTVRCARLDRASRYWIDKTCPTRWHDCAVCGQPFYSRRPRLTCSAECAKRRSSGLYVHRPHPSITATCSECGKPFTYRRYNLLRTVCTRRCKVRRYARLNPMAWQDGRSRRRHARRAREKGAAVERFSHRLIYQRDGWRCGICGLAVDAGLSYPHPLSASLDHVVPLALGGQHMQGNVRLAHLICNSVRGTKPSSQPVLAG